MNDLKKELFGLCLDYVEKAMLEARMAIDDAQKASKDDTKSSAGDKYETGRAMMQQETDRNMVQLNEANKLKVTLNKINPKMLSTTVDNGSVAITDNGNFFLAIGAGAFILNKETYYTISAYSPMGLKLKGLKAGDKFRLNGKDYQLKTVF